MLRSSAVVFILFNLLAGTVLAVNPARAQDQVEIVANQASQQFPDKITFSLEAAGAEKVTAVKLLYGTSGRTCQTGQASQSPDFEINRTLKVSWTWELQRSGALPVGTEVWWQWEVYDAEGLIAATEVQRLSVEDPRHDWKTVESEGIRVRWYAGERSFGAALLRIAQDSLNRLEHEMGVSLGDRANIIIYPTVYELQEALIVTADWAGGVAFPDHNSMVLAIAPEEIEWAREVIPHELAHLVTSVRIFNCRGGWMPAWLGEGLAMYAEGPVPEKVRERIVSELEKGGLPPLQALASGFSAYGEEAGLNYDQSTLVVEYLLVTYDAEKMDTLLSEIQQGKSTNGALEAVYGMDTAGVDAAWRASLGYGSSGDPGEAAATPTRTAIPTLAMWTSAAQASPSPSATPGPAATPTRTPAPTRTVTPAPPTAVSQEADPPGDGESGAGWILATVSVAFLTLAGGVILWKRFKVGKFKEAPT